MISPPERHITAVIVDDEFPARQRLSDLLEGEPDIHVAGMCANGYDAIETLNQQNPDVVFLDIQMPELSGFDVLSALNEAVNPLIIFVTAYDEYALRAFEVHAFDYLLKPFDDIRFSHMLERVRTQLSLGQKQAFATKLMAFLQANHLALPTSMPPEKEQHTTSPERFCVKHGQELLFIPVEDVEYIKGAGVYVSLHLKGKEYLLRESLAHLEDQLDEQLFCRIHRSTIVNHTRIKKLQHIFNGDYRVTLQDDTQLRLSRSYRTQLAACLGHTF